MLILRNPKFDVFAFFFKNLFTESNHKVYYGLLKEPDLQSDSSSDEEEEDETSVDGEKTKKRKAKKDRSVHIDCYCFKYRF